MRDEFGRLGLDRPNVLVTRPRQQADNLCDLIEQKGWNPIRFPTLNIVRLKNTKIQQQLRVLKDYDWLIFISTNAVNFAIEANNGKIEVFKNSRIVAIGRATESALKLAGLQVSLIPEKEFNTEGLLVTLEMNNVIGQSCLIIRGQGGRERLAESLRERGALVDYMEVYSRQQPTFVDKTVSQLLQRGKMNVMTITSGDAIKNMMAMIETELHGHLYSVPLVVISKRLKEMADTIGFRHVVVAKSPDDSAITEAILLSLSLSIN